MSDYIKSKEYKLPNGRTVTADFNELGCAMVTIQAMDALFDILNSSDVVEADKAQKEIDYWHDKAQSYEQTILKLSLNKADYGTEDCKRGDNK